MPLKWLMKKLSRKRYERDYATNKLRSGSGQKERSGSLSDLSVRPETKANDYKAETIDGLRSKKNKKGRKNSRSQPDADEMDYHQGAAAAVASEINQHTQGKRTKRGGTRSQTQVETEDMDYQDDTNAAVASGIPGPVSPTGRTYIVMYDYTARTHQDLTIKKNEYVELVDPVSDGWWLMRSHTSGNAGFVPANYVAEHQSMESHPWYFGKIRRTECEQRLLADENQSGSYLIRDSESRINEYSLSARDGQGVRHYRIRTAPEGGYCINKANVFTNLQDLVTFYSSHRTGLFGRLVKPCIKLVTPETVGLSHDTCDHWEIPREQLVLSRRLGSGNFGDVYEGHWNDTHPVAVKTLKTGTMRKEDFLAEAQFLKELRHPNLLQLYAVCTLEEPLYIVTELMLNGSLLDYLRGKGRNIDLEIQISVGTQVARGMEYLEGKNYIHRDLAARNVLVGENYTVKVADFGLSRFVKEEEYEAREGAQFPIKWTAPEAITYNRFSIKSDVWSFGILLAEIITHGAKPYPGMSNVEVARNVDQGYRMPKPTKCPLLLYNIMMECWDKDAVRRPTFTTLTWQLEDFFSTEATEYKEADEVI